MGVPYNDYGLMSGGDGSGTTFDPLTGTPSYYTDSSMPSAPQTGDSGVTYGQQILDLLKFGVQANATQKQYEYDSKMRFEASRQGLTAFGQPVNAVQVGGAIITPTMVLLGVALVGLALYHHGA